MSILSAAYDDTPAPSNKVRTIAILGEGFQS